MHSRPFHWRRRFTLTFALAGCVAVLHPAARASYPWNFKGLSAAPPSGKAVHAGVFPVVSAEALDKSVIDLPAQLEGRENLLVLAWERDQSPQMETWTAVAQALQHSHPDFRVYRMLVSAPENFLFRWWDNASLRAAETDPDLLHWSVPIYMDKATLHSAIGLGANEKSITVLLVDRAGKIQWKAQGDSTAATRASLAAAVNGR